MEGDYFFRPRDWNLDKEFAVIEVNDFMERYLLDLNLGSISNSFMEIVELEELPYLSGYTAVKTWIKFWEYCTNNCEPIKLSNAMKNPEFPPDFPPLDYYTLNKIVFHYLVDVNLVEEARTFALHTSDDNPDGIDFVDYTVVDSVREFIVPFTAYIWEYSPNSEAGKKFLFKEDADKYTTEEEMLPEFTDELQPPKPGQTKALFLQPPKPPRPKLKPVQLFPNLDQLMDINVKSSLPNELLTLPGELKPSEVTEICQPQPQPQQPWPEAPPGFENMNPTIERAFASLRASRDLGYLPPQVVPSSYPSLTLTGELKPSEVIEICEPQPQPPWHEAPPGFPNLNPKIDRDLGYLPPQVVPSSNPSLTLTGEHKPPYVTEQPKPPPLPPKPPRPKGKPPRPSPNLDQLMDSNVKSLLPTELDRIPLPVEIISRDSSLTLTGEQKPSGSELTEQPSPQPKSSLELLIENYSSSDSDEHLPPSKIRREDSGDN